MRRLLTLAAGVTLAAASVAGLAGLVAGPAVAASSSPQVTAAHLRPLGPFRVMRVDASGFELINQAHGLCLDANSSGTSTNGDVVQLYSCGAANKLNQDWKTPSGTTEIVNDAGGLCWPWRLSRPGPQPGPPSRSVSSPPNWTRARTR